MKCHPRTSMTIEKIKGEDRVVWNWSCIACKVTRKSYSTAGARNKALAEHTEK